MKIFSVTVGLLSFLGIIFGYWGAFTVAGQKHYEEMAGMFPFFVLVGSAGILSLLLLILFIQKIRRGHNLK